MGTQSVVESLQRKYGYCESTGASLEEELQGATSRLCKHVLPMFVACKIREGGLPSSGIAPLAYHGTEEVSQRLPEDDWNADPERVQAAFREDDWNELPMLLDDVAGSCAHEHCIQLTSAPQQSPHRPVKNTIRS